MKQLTKIGYIVKSHKLNGAVKIILDDYALLEASTPKHLFIETNSTTLPFFIEKLEAIGNNELIVKFEELDSKESVAGLKGKGIFIDESKAGHQSFKKIKQVDDELNLFGYDLFDDKNNFIAKIEAVYFVPNNPLVAILIENEEVLLPLNEKLIVDINNKQKKVCLKIPEGLLNLNEASNEEE